MGNGLTLSPLPGTVERNGAWKGAEMMEEARQDTLWVPQREDAYKAHGEILRRFSQNKVPGISIQRRWRREAQVWGFLVERGFCMKDGEHSFEDDLALLVAKENMIRIKAFCGMAAGLRRVLRQQQTLFMTDGCTVSRGISARPCGGMRRSAAPVSSWRQTGRGRRGSPCIWKRETSPQRTGKRWRSSS